MKRESWHTIVRQSEDAGADGLELNFGCPHGMSERGMGSAVGQVPEYAQMITEWVKEVAKTPVLVKLTPNVTDIRAVARAAKRGGADGLSAINTYLGTEQDPADYARMVSNDLMGITRDDLVYDLGRHVDESVHLFEEWGLPIWKTDENGERHDGSKGLPALKDGGKPVRPANGRS